MSESVERLAQLFLDLQGQITTLANKPQLPASSIPRGESIDVVDPETGQPIMIIGEQHDGTVGAVPIDGPVPPVPSAPVVESGIGLTITYDGRMASGEDRFPMDGEGVEAWIRPLPEPDAPGEPGTEPVPDPGDDPDDPTPPEPVPDLDDIDTLDAPFPGLAGAQLVHTFPAAGGTATVALPVGGWMVALVTRTVPGRRSAPSAIGIGEVTSVLDAEVMADLEQRLDDNETAVDTAREGLEELRDERLPQVDSNLQAVGELLAAVRERVGNKRWVGPSTFTVPDFTTAVDFVRVEPLGGGMVRFTALLPGPHTEWRVGGVVTGDDGPVMTRTFSTPGDYWVRVTSGGVQHQAPVSITPAMMVAAEDLWDDIEWPEIDWSQASIALDQLTVAGILAPDVLAMLRQDVLVAGIVLATEAFIGGHAILENSLQARHVVASESLSAKVAEFIEVAVDKLVVTEEAHFSLAVVDRLFADVFAVKKILAEHADLGSFAADEGFAALMRAAVFIAGAVPPSALAVGVEELIPDPMWEQADRHRVPQGSAYRWSTGVAYRRGGQARTLWLSGSALTVADRLYLTDAPDGQGGWVANPIPARPGERFQLALDAHRASGAFGVAIGLEVLDSGGVKIGDVVVAAPAAQATEAMVTTDGVVVVPDGGFAVRPWVGADPATTPVVGSWYVSRVSMRGVQASTTQQGYTTQVTGRGLETLTPNLEPMTQLGAFERNGLVLLSTSGDNAGDTTVAITDDGRGAFVELAAGSIWYRGTELADVLTEHESRIVTRMSFSPYQFDNIPGTGGFLDMVEVGFQMQSGHLYRIVARPINVLLGSASGDTAVSAGLHWTTNGSRPTRASERIFLDHHTPSSAVSQRVTFDCERLAHGSGFARVLLSVSAATRSLSLMDVASLYVEDLGLDPGPDDGTVRNYVRANAGDPAPPTPSPKTRKRSPFGRAWIKSWQENGQSPNAIAGKAFQGYTRHYSSAGLYRSMVGFNNMTGTLSGVDTADIEKIEVGITNGYTYATTFVIRPHGETSVPGSFSQETAHGSVMVTVPAGQTRWVAMPASTHGGWKNGTFRGVSFFAPGTGAQYYGYASQVTALATYRS